MNSSIRLPGHQRGIATIWAVIFLIVGVTITLTQVLDIAKFRSLATAQQSDSTAALFVAESGLQRAKGTLNKAINTGGTQLTAGSCTGIKPADPLNAFPVGTSDGSFSYVIASTPLGQESCTGAGCTECSVTVKGTQGGAARTLSTKFKFLSTNKGTSGCGSSITLTVKNSATTPATAVFNLGWRRQMNTNDYPSGCTPGAGGNATATPCSDCGEQWNVESSSGSPSVGSIGTSVPINVVGGSSTEITQALTTTRNYAEVAGLFPGVAGLTFAPPIVGSYWKTTTPGLKTTNNSASTPSRGLTNSGVATATGTCAPITDGVQSCNNWCYGADTLVFAASGRSASFADTFTAVTFNTSGSPLQNVPLENIAHFPNTDGTFQFTKGDIYGEIWFAYNPNLSKLNNPPDPIANETGAQPDPRAFNVSSYKGNGSGDVSTASPPVLTITAACTVCAFAVGDSVKITGIAAPDRTITALTGSGGIGSTYTLSGAALTTPLTNAAVLAYLPADLTDGRLYLPSGERVPTQPLASGTLPNGTLAINGTRVAMFSGAGVLAANTVASPYQTVNSATNSFIVNPAPTTPLNGATICGGTCAFFNAPSSTTAITEFIVTRSGGTDQWGGGFTCLRGVDKEQIQAVTDISSIVNSTWSEPVNP